MSDVLYLAILDRLIGIRCASEPALRHLNMVYGAMQCAPPSRRLRASWRLDCPDGHTWRISRAHRLYALYDDLITALWNLEFHVLREALTRDTRHLVFHAACVTLGGDALALMGDSGSGKSTAALRLLERGCRLVSDEWTAWRKTDGALVPIPRAPLVKAGADLSGSSPGARHDNLLQHLDGRGYRAVPRSCVSRVRPYRLQVVELARGIGPPRIQPLSLAAAMHRLVEACFFRDRFDQKAFTALVNQVSARPALRLSGGRPEEVERLLSGLMGNRGAPA